MPTVNSDARFVYGLLGVWSMENEIRTACVHTCLHYVLENYISSFDFTKTLPSSLRFTLLPAQTLIS